MSIDSKRSFSDLPPEVTRFLIDPLAFEQVDTIIENYKLVKEKRQDFLGLANEVVFGTLALADIPKKIQELFNISFEEAKKIAVEFVAHRLLPITDYVGNIEGYIKAWGGNPVDYTKIERVEIRSMQVETFIEDIFNFSPELLSDPSLKHRAISLLALFIKGEKTLDETKDVLERSEKVGGLGMSKEQIETLLTIFEQKKNERQKPFLVSRAHEPIEINSSRTFEPIFPRIPVVPKIPSVSQVNTKEETEEQADIKKQKEELHKHLLTISPIFQPEDGLRILKSKVFDIQGLSSFIAPPEKQKRFLEIVESRLREVRSPLVTKLQLEKSWEEGGLGMNGSFLVDVVRLIEGIFDALQKGETQRLNQEQQTQKEQRQQQEAGRKDLQKKEAEILTKRYIEKTGKVPDQKWISPVAPSLSRTTLNKTSRETIEQAQTQIQDQKVQATIKKDLASKSIPNLSQVPVVKPKLQDVLPPPKLIGPIEELREMRLIDFRRLSKDPSVAITKLHDKIDLLEDEGYVKKIQAIQAWRSSALYRDYILISRALLDGKALKDILQEHSQEMGQTMTEQEFRLIMSLNKSLRF